MILMIGLMVLIKKYQILIGEKTQQLTNWSNLKDYTKNDRSTK